MATSDLYLDLMKQVLTRSGFDDGTIDPPLKDLRATNWMRHILEPAQRLLAKRNYRLVEDTNLGLSAAQRRSEGRDWPATAETMIGRKRLDNIQECVETVLTDDVPGDLIETGVWRGGATIFMRAILAADGNTDRTVWVADSFSGLPEPDAEKYPADAGDDHSTFEQLAVSADQVRANFERYGLLDAQVRFLEGWFADTLPDAPIEQLAVCRLDGDMYGSTWDAITVLEPKLSSGGFLIVDDYYAVEGCRKAIHDYRDRKGIIEPIVDIDTMGAYWRKH